SYSTTVNDQIVARKDRRQQRLEALIERREYYQRRVDEATELNTKWKKAWAGVTDDSVAKPRDMTWMTFFETLADIKADSVPVMFHCTDAKMPKSNMLMALAVHVSSIQTNLDKDSKILQNIIQSDEACRRAEVRIEERSQKKLKNLVDTERMEQAAADSKTFGCKKIASFGSQDQCM
ncbi:unnamed protein product, partial [Durusdinium trenchii]